MRLGNYKYVSVCKWKNDSVTRQPHYDEVAAATMVQKLKERKDVTAAWTEPYTKPIK